MSKNPFIRATLTEPVKGTKAYNWSGIKETTAHHALVVVHKGEILTPITSALYMGRSARASQVWASFWLRPANSGEWFTGRGKAGGYGYCKGSAALARAIDNAGVKLYGNLHPSRQEKNGPVHFGGTGFSDLEAIYKAIARAAGYRGKMKLI